MSRLLRIICCAMIACFAASSVNAKYCVKLPTCEELGYVFKYIEGRRVIRCPFDTDKVLLLDYCQQYGLTSCDPSKGECEYCKETRYDNTTVTSEYARYTRCKQNHTYNNGECVPSGS